VLIAAPTGSGKTLAAFLAAVDALVRQGLRDGLRDETSVVYVSPLKALSNDIQRNLAAPLAGIREELVARGLPDLAIRTLVRTGDTPQHERAAMRRRPPHIVVTTPESLYILLGSASGRAMLATTRTVIVDEIHALASNKRGSHLALSLARLDALVAGADARPLTRIGLSATQKPIEEVARFLGGDPIVVDVGHVRPRDLALEVPASPLEAVMSNEVWTQVYARLAELIAGHRTTLVFVNTRRMAERATRHLSELLGAEHVMAHHGSMAKHLRLTAEQRLKSGGLKALVATASLELGIDIGDVERVCQFGSPRAIATFLQGAGRASHTVRGVPKARLFPLSRDELVECTALLAAVERGELDRLAIPRKPLDVLAQQIVAEVAAREWPETALYEALKRAYPYAELTPGEYREIVRVLADGFSTRQGHRAAYLHRDAVHGMLRARRGARLTALTSGGAIPDTADYDVVLEPAGQLVGTVNEDFAVESLAGDVFQLGNTSYRIRRIEAGRVRVEDAHGQAPNIPFWLGEAPARSDELSQAVARLRDEIFADADATRGGVDTAVAIARLEAHGIAAAAGSQLVDYLAAARAVLGALPTQDTIVLERFFDESGGMQLVIHAPFGSRINRAWGLALRKRFCVRFNFELQAAATEDAIVISLSTSHSFPLADVVRYVNAASVRGVVVQAMLAAPMFAARWRWTAATSLALPRFRGGRKTPAPLMRMRADDLMAAVFPDQIACAENRIGDREIPDHPLVQQTVDDCLHEAMDIDGLERLLRRIERGDVAIVARDLPAPSPLAMEILSARPYAYLDDAPLEERRTQAVLARRWNDDDAAGHLGRLDVAAIERVRTEAWPEAASLEEMHDALLTLGFVTVEEAQAREGWSVLLSRLASERRATRLALAPSGNVWVAAERLPEFDALQAGVPQEPPVEAPAEYAARAWTREDALAELTRSRLQALGPVTVAALAESLALPQSDMSAALARLAGEGIALEGSYTPGAMQREWCDRSLLARIHRRTIERLRREIEPVSTQDFVRFLFRWQHVAPGEQRQGPDALDAVIAQLQGFEAPAVAWEADLLPARLEDYDFTWLDDLCLAGRAIWTRLTPAAASGSGGAASIIRSTPITLLPRRSASMWSRVAPKAAADGSAIGSRAALVADFLRAHGASFFDEIVDGTRLLRTQVEDALAELVALGTVTSDGFAGLRALLTPAQKRKRTAGRRVRRSALPGVEDAGRWTLTRRIAPASPDVPTAADGHRAGSVPDHEAIEHIARVLLRRYGVVGWRLLQREAGWLPPWRELSRVFRRLEARGDVRGGRFVASVTGEQFALPEAVAMLRETRRMPSTEALVSVNAADPLNLVGTLLPGARIPALAGNRVLYRDGVAVAALVAGEVRRLEPLEGAAARAAEDALIRHHVGTPLPAYLR
jgi:ATP-dependent Lhr-like helicase